MSVPIDAHLQLECEASDADLFVLLAQKLSELSASKRCKSSKDYSWLLPT